MYQKYQTDAFVLRSYERGEADRVFALFTREFGFVWARASAVRRENSRMRYSLQNGAVAHISLVRGNKGWRVAGASAVAQLDMQQASGASAFSRIALLLERLAGGEQQNTYLFDTLVESHAALMSEAAELHPVIELVAVARMLFALGYLSQEAFGTALFAETAFTHAGLREVQDVRPKLLSSVNKALSETQL
jgi:recombinational DNA repair protein (RecF pathway)